MTRTTIDTNVFFYALDSREPQKRAAAIELIERLRSADCMVALQTCGELYAALTKKMRRAPWEAAQAARNVLATFPSFGAGKSAVERALAEAMAGRFHYWDALLLASAHDAGCAVCFSEDMSDGGKLAGVEVIAPFGPEGLSDRARAILASL